MNPWFGFILLSTCSYALITLLDRHVMGLRMISPIAYLLFGNIVGLLVVSIIWLTYVGNFVFHIDLILLGLLTGVLFGLFTYLYFLTLQSASPVATVAYMQLVPAFSAIASIYLLGEEITAIRFLAILLLSIGLTFVSLLDRKQSGHAANLMAPAVILLSIGYIIQKHLLAEYSVTVLLVLNRAGATIIGIIIFLWLRINAREQLPVDVSSRRIGSIASVIGELGSIIALYFLLCAYNSGPFPEVSAIAATLPVVVLVGAVIINRVSTQAFWMIPEISTPGNLLLTIIATALISLAVYMISGVAIVNGQ